MGLSADGFAARGDDYLYYAIQPEAMVLGVNGSNTSSNTVFTSPKVIIDSGTTLNILPFSKELTLDHPSFPPFLLLSPPAARP